MSQALNRYPLWKYVLVLFVLILACIYAAPNLYGQDPALQIKSANDTPVKESELAPKIKSLLNEHRIQFQSIQMENDSMLVRFASTDMQIQAKDVVQHALGDQYLTALNLASNVPEWLKSINAQPMKLGLDLRGGVHFLLEVDVESVVKQRVEGDLRSIGQVLRDAKIRYSDLSRQSNSDVIILFRSEDAFRQAQTLLRSRFHEFSWENITASAQGEFALKAILLPQALFQARQEILEQTMNTLRNRVNELGVSEAIVQQTGVSRISVDLPGIQDTAEAKNIIGKTATLELRMVDTEHSTENSTSRLYTYNDQPIYLKNEVVLRGSSIVAARSGTDEYGHPNVEIRLNGAGESLFTKTTAENIGKPMAIVFVEVKSTVETKPNGERSIRYQTEKRIISAPTIQSVLGANFQITGLKSNEEAKTLALLLRAGALPTPIAFIEERQVGPSLGKQNISMGERSVELGMFLVFVFMAVYYRFFGMIANLALLANLVLIVALLSLIGATLTLPGIAGIVLTVGMAVDANVLIFERIREELRRGMGVQASIYAGYDRAFTTILDANLTTLIVMLILYGMGSGMVKGLAITITIGLLTSMFTAITGTRALINLVYGKRSRLQSISIGI